MPLLGMRVLRGPDWDQSEADGGEGHLGTVVGVKAEEGTAEVVWDNGQVTMCRVGKEGKHDLRIYDNATAGECVSRGVVCQGCRNSSIYGTSWRCSTCSNLHLCSRCYHLGVHPLSHTFLRRDDHTQQGVAVGTRSGASRSPVFGIFPEGRVARGRDWEYGDADGGPDGSGMVVEVVSPESGSARNAVRVSWDSGQSLQHRLGLHGKVDLVCTEEAPGPACYVSHLPVLDCKHVSKNQHAPAQPESGEGKTQGEKKREIKEGDRVRIVSDVELLQRQQRDHGGWVDDMNKAAGKVGTVRNVNHKGDVRVHFGQQYWIFNPDSCQPAPECAEDFIPLEGVSGTLKGLIEGLHRQVKEALGPDLSKKMEQLSSEMAGSPTLGELFRAVISEDSGKMSRLIEQEPGLVHQTIMGSTALHYAAADGQEEAVRLLVAKGSDINKGDKDEDTPLLLAVQRSQPHLVKTLMELGADINLSNEDGQTPLHIAVLTNNDVLLRLLLQNKASVNRRDIRGDTPLFDAIQNEGCSQSIVEALLAEADIDLQMTNRDGFNALHLSALMNRPRIAERLLARDPILCKVVMENRKVSALHIAAANGYTEMVQVLIKAGSPVDLQCSTGETPLHFASCEDFISCVKILVENGADVNALNHDHETPLHLCFGPSRNLMKQLLQKSRSDQTEKGLEVAKYLVQCGARSDIRNRAGSTVLDNAPVAVREKLKRFITEMYVVGLQRKLQRTEKAPDTITNAPPQRPSNSAPARCVTCQQRDADVVFLPCAHKLVCHYCAGSARVCQECRKVIEGEIDTEGKPVGNVTRADTNMPSNETSGPQPSEKGIDRSEDMDEGEIRVGDKVRIGVDVETFSIIQKQRNAWTRQMIKCVGKTGVVKGKTETGELVVDFDGEKWRIDPIGLTKGHVPERPKEDDIVKIISDVRLLEEQQKNHGGWNPKMAECAGKVGQIMTTVNGDCVVKFGQQLWTFNPKSLTPAPGCSVDFIAAHGHEAHIRAKLAERLQSPTSRTIIIASDSPEVMEFFSAAQDGDSRKMATILESNPGLVKADVQDITALHIVCSGGRTEAARLLVARGADINMGDNDGDTPLARCVYHDRVEMARTLIELGADVNAANKKRMTPLHLAVAVDRTDFVRLLLQNLAAVNRRDSELSTPIFMAVAKDTTNPAILDALLATGDLDLKLTSNQQATALHMAVHRKKKRDVEKILARDSSLVNAVMEDRLTPLHVAADRDLTDITRLLLKANAPVNAQARKQMTPLHMTSAHDYLECSKILVENGADVNATDEDGDTPLHLFCLSAYKQAVKRLLGESSSKGDKEFHLPRYLVEHGARPDLRNGSGRTAMDVAPEHLKEELIRLYSEGKNQNANDATFAARPNEDPKKCITCYKREADVIFLPCAHKLLCRHCAGSHKDCRECGKTIEGQIDTDGNPVEASNSSTSNEGAKNS